MRYTYLLVLCMALSGSLFAQSKLGPQLQRQLAEAPANAEFRVSLLFSEQLPYLNWLYAFEQGGETPDFRAKFILRESQGLAARSLSEFLPELERIKGRPSHQIKLLEAFWLVNVLELQVNAAAIEALANLPMVARLEMSNEFTFELESPVATADAPEAPNGREPGLTAIGAPFMWQLGYTGKGLRAMLIDTGVWPSHPAIGGKFLGNRLPLEHSWLGYDFVRPQDKAGNHGTHVIGTVLGLDSATNDTIGVAFGAYFIATDPVANSQTTSKPILEYVRAYQWALNPDGDSSTTDDIPAVINNSWGRTNQGNDSLCNHPIMQPVLIAVEAAGIANVFSAGNNGPGPGTGGFLAQIAIDTLSLFAVGALDGSNASYPIAGFSSRGPSTCVVSGPPALSIKPEVSAPGVNVRSADGPTGYGTKSGTSMAAPHVSGAVLLLKEAFPMASGRQLLNALYQTAIDLGDPGEDNVYGRGIINLPAAYNFLAASFTPATPASRAYDLAIAGVDSPATSFLGINCAVHPDSSLRQQFRIRVRNEGDSTVQGFTLYYQYNGGARDSVSFSGTLAARQEVSLLTPAIYLTDSTHHRLQFEVVAMSGPAEMDQLNNRWHLDFNARRPRTLPMLETFEASIQSANPTNDWVIRDLNNDGRTWEFFNVNGAPGTTTAAGILMRNIPRGGQLDELISPPLQFGPMQPGGSSLALLRFHLAYAPRSSNFSDSLFVDISTDCGHTYTRVYTNGGDSMRTFTGIDPAEPSHWKQILLNHPALEPNQPNAAVRLKFTTRNDFGGNLYLTNIGYLLSLSVQPGSHQPDVLMYPNPTSAEVRLSSQKARMQRVLLRDITGRLLAQFQHFDDEHALSINLSSYPAGMYLLQIETNEGPITQRLLKQ